MSTISDVTFSAFHVGNLHIHIFSETVRGQRFGGHVRNLQIEMNLPWLSKYGALSDSDLSEDFEKAERTGFLRGIRGHGLFRSSKKAPMLMIAGTIFNLVILFISLTLFLSSHDFGRNTILRKSSFYCRWSTLDS